jgi:hypothetical protein
VVDISVGTVLRIATEEVVLEGRCFIKVPWLYSRVTQYKLLTYIIALCNERIRLILSTNNINKLRGKMHMRVRKF